MSGNILITGANGQIGSELVSYLSKKYGAENVVASDLNISTNHAAKFEKLDVTDIEMLENVCVKHEISQIYHLAALLSATGEKKPELAWQVNMGGLLNVLNVAEKLRISKVFWPSSIAIFGPDSPKVNTPQNTFCNPSTIYGITKLAGEQLCRYYCDKRNLDVRSIRYPGLISYKTKAGGGTTDYAVDIYFEAKEKENFECFLAENTVLPMMFMDDAIRGTVELMETDKTNLSTHDAYNFAGISFSPKEIAESIQKHIPDFRISYKPDFRQQIAESWPQSIDDSLAQKDWNWQKEFDLDKMTEVMLQNVY